MRIEVLQTAVQTELEALLTVKPLPSVGTPLRPDLMHIRYLPSSSMAPTAAVTYIWTNDESGRRAVRNDGCDSARVGALPHIPDPRVR